KRIDVGSKRTDVGSKRIDIGSKRIDAGSKRIDDGSKRTDAGSKRIDAGSKRIDAGSKRTDIGTKRTDAGTRRIDAGPNRIDAGSKRADIATVSLQFSPLSAARCYQAPAKVRSALEASATVVSIPAVQSITRVGPATTNAAIVQFSVAFTEPVVNVATDDFTATTGGGLTGASVVGVTGSGPYTVSVNTGSGDGTIRLDVNGTTATINDPARNALTASFTTGGGDT